MAPSVGHRGGVQMVAGRGTPTVQFVTLYQLKLLGVPAGEPTLWRRILYQLKHLGIPFAGHGVVTKFKMSTIQNFETIVHLHWLRQKHLGASLDQLIGFTASVKYAETTAVQSGYRRVGGTRYVPAEEWENAIDCLMGFHEKGNRVRIDENNALLQKYGFVRSTVMKQNFDIAFDVAPQ